MIVVMINVFAYSIKWNLSGLVAQDMPVTADRKINRSLREVALEIDKTIMLSDMSVPETGQRAVLLHLYF